MIDLGLTLFKMRPGAAWSLPDANDYSTLVWLDEAQTAPTLKEMEAYVEPAPTVTSVTPRQARLALLQAGLLDKVEAAVNAAGGATKITWDWASTISRTDPLIATLATVLSLTSAQIDQLFTTASTL